MAREGSILARLFEEAFGVFSSPFFHHPSKAKIRKKIEEGEEKGGCPLPKGRRREVKDTLTKLKCKESKIEALQLLR